MHPLAALIVLVAVALAAPAADARSLTIETGKYGVRKLGPLDTRSTRTYSPTVAAARRALGRPSNVLPNGGGGCVGKWRRLGLRIVFADFGGGTGPVCGRAKASRSRSTARARGARGRAADRDGAGRAGAPPPAGALGHDDAFTRRLVAAQQRLPFGTGARRRSSRRPSAGPTGRQPV